MRIRSGRIVIATWMVASLPAWAVDGPGLHATDASWFHGRWQARIELSQGLSGRQPFDRYHLRANSNHSSLHRLSVLRDYYFEWGEDDAAASPAAAGGLRATGGLIVTSRSASTSPRRVRVPGMQQGLVGGAIAGGWSNPNNDLVSVPYMGVGYTELPLRTGWGFRADLGLMAMQPQSAARFGTALSGLQGMDTLLRDMRLSPLIQVGVSYSF